MAALLDADQIEEAQRDVHALVRLLDEANRCRSAFEPLLEPCDLAEGFGIGTSTVYRYLREGGLELLAAMAPTLDEAIAVAARKGLRHPRRHLLRIDRVGMIAKQDRPCYSGKHKAHG